VRQGRIGDPQGRGTRPYIFALDLEALWVDGAQSGVERPMMIRAQDEAISGVIRSLLFFRANVCGVQQLWHR
jgi:hypothetical protein